MKFAKSITCSSYPPGQPLRSRKGCESCMSVAEHGAASTNQASSSVSGTSRSTRECVLSQGMRPRRPKKRCSPVCASLEDSPSLLSKARGDPKASYLSTRTSHSSSIRSLQRTGREWHRDRRLAPRTHVYTKSALTLMSWGSGEGLPSVLSGTLV